MEKSFLFESRFIDRISYLLLMQPSLWIFSRAIKPCRSRIWSSPTHHAIERHWIEGLHIFVQLFSRQRQQVREKLWADTFCSLHPQFIRFLQGFYSTLPPMHIFLSY